MEKIHVFEAAGLGKAPFKLVGIFELPSKALQEANPDAYNNALRSLPLHVGMGTCHFCGHAIMVNCMIQSADGKKFMVGTDCVAKTGDKGLVDKVKMERRKQAREKREEKRRAEFRKAAEDRKAHMELELKAQRERNGGLTDEEVKQQKLNAKIAKLAPLADALDDGRGVFRQSVAIDMRRTGQLPRGRGRDIMLEILAKQKGRSGTKAFLAEYERLEKFVEEFEAENQ